MTHTNHREGTKELNMNDYIILVMPAKGYNNNDGIVNKMRETWNVLTRHNPINGGGINTNILLKDRAENIRKQINKNTPMLLAVYNNSYDFQKAVKEIKNNDFGISVVLTGLINEIKEMVKKYNIDFHSIEYSLGVHGNKAKLPDSHIREIVTMCGHGMISKNLAKDILTKIKNNRITIDEAVQELGKQCVCGIFNVDKAKKIIMNNLE